MIPKYARYQYCIEKSIEFILNENLNIFPFDCDYIIKNHKWAKLKYSSLAAEFNVSIDKIIEAYGSQDGYSSYSGRNYTIAYNNTQIPKRIYFTKLHEIGHIYLNHFVDFDETIIKRCSISNESYKVLENEANCFARNVIAPVTLVKTLNLSSPIEIANFFGITDSAAKTRYDLLNTDYSFISTNNENKLISFWNNSPHSSKRYCLRCYSNTASKHSKYCSICGSNNLILGDGKMIYSGYALDKNKRVVRCPKCENEEIALNNGSFCNICGTNLYNRCSNSNCGTVLTGNARYCEQCGTISTFEQNSFFNDWQKEKNEGEFPF